MKRATTKESGSAFIAVVLVAMVVAVAVFAGYRYFQAKDNKTAVSSSSSGSPKIKSLAINLDYYNASTNKAGDVEFRKWDFTAGGLDAIFSEYGRSAAANNSQGAGRRNPQPTFLAPVGTKVLSLVDGVVVNVPKLYSNDYSIHVQPKGSDMVFETEHVKGVLVKKGDTVKAGQVIAEVSDYDAKNLNGLGLVEIGILVPGNPPKHVCTFDYLDDSIKADTLKKITALEDAWEKFVGNASVYNQQNEPVPGCTTRDQIEG